MRNLILVLLLVLLIVPGPLAAQEKALVDDSGALQALADGKALGKCPLKHTDVKADISGFFARVEVTQTFGNPYDKKIEAVYTFPLPENAAVYRMDMKIGDRLVKGVIKRKEEARKIYDDARRQGHVASLLDQERPNVFVQQVANIEPGVEVEITIRYLDVLPYNAGKFTFAFPTVVGPRYHPVGTPDSGKVNTPVTPKGTRAGHDISIAVRLNAGMAFQNLKSELHAVKTTAGSTGMADIVLEKKAEIPNRDFILSWEVAEDQVKSGFIAHKTGDEDGYFVLVLIPPKKVTVEQAQPKEMIFVVDRSGSQSGLPLEKAKDTLLYILDHMNPSDTFQLIDFASGFNKLFEKPQPFSDEMASKARDYIRKIEANGGTEMAAAVRAACAEPGEDHRLRIVTLMTDGYIGNDLDVVKLVRDLRGKSRWFPFGTGNGVNRFLIEKMAEEGGGESEIVTLNADSKQVAETFYNRIKYPVLTDIQVDFDGVKVDEVYPRDPSDLWDRKPIVLKGRFHGHGAGTIVLRGYHGGSAYEEKIPVNWPQYEEGNGQVAQIWARAKIEQLMRQNWSMQRENNKDADNLKEQVIETALKYSLMSQFTSFVAVEETTVTKGGEPVKVDVPVEMPEGVSYDGVFGDGGMVLSEESVGYGGGMYNKAMPASMAPRGRMERELRAQDAMAIPEPEPIAVKPTLPVPVTPPVTGAVNQAGLFDAGLEALLKRYEAGSLAEKDCMVTVRVEFSSWIDTLAAWSKKAKRVVFRSERGGKLVVEIHIKELRALEKIAGVLKVRLEK